MIRTWIVAIAAISFAGCPAADTRDDEKPKTDPAVESLRRACVDAKEENSVAACRKVLRIRPRDAQAEHSLGWQLCLQGKVSEGVAHLRKAMALNPGDPEICYHLGVALERRGDRAGAMKAYEDACRLKNDYTEARIACGVLARKMKKKELSESTLRKAVEIDPGSASGWAQLSLTLAQQGRLGEAIDAGLKAVEIEPEDANARSNLGLFMTNAGRAEEGVKHLAKAIELDPGNATALYNLGLAFTKTDALEEAVRAYHRAILVREEFPEAHHNMAVILIGLEICGEAKRHLDRAHELRVRSAPIVMEQYKARCERPEPGEEQDAPADAEAAGSSG
jgi:Flp pilus assembly protein TadD